MPELCLAGCAPVPLAAYLKALAVLRLVARQADPDARGRWVDDVFALRCRLSEDELVDFFLDRYSPTPIVSPWNGGSGFGAGDRSQRAALERLEGAGGERLAVYRETVVAARKALAGADVSGAKDAKAALVARCRATFPDAALDWLDAALVMTPDGLRFPPLLLSGGNDGRLDFSTNFVQRLGDVLPELGGTEQRERSADWLRAALFDSPAPPLREAAVGMFNPGAAGGANATAGFEGVSLVNPWDFVLTMEGVVLFAGAAARRMHDADAGGVAFPFTVEPSTAGVALGASPAERARAEVWLPLWSAPAGLAEVEHLCAEGRAEWRGRQARDAVEFAQAVAALGVARGIDDFARYAIHKRMGKNHVATPVGRVQVRRRPEADLLAGVDWWLRRFRDRVGDDAPAGLRDCRRRLEQAIFELCLRGGRTAASALLVELGRAELAVAVREPLAGEVPPLELHPDWLRGCDDGSAEFRLAAAVGSLGAGTELPLRSDLEPVAFEGRRPVRRPSRSEAGRLSGADRRLAAVLRRRLLDAEMTGDPRLAFRAARAAPLADVGALLRDEVNVEEVADLAAALSLVRWPAPDEDAAAAVPSTLPRAYALLVLCRLPHDLQTRGGTYVVPVEPAVIASLAAGRPRDAVRLAAARLRGSGLRLHRAAGALELAAGLRPEHALAALLVPISRAAASALADSVSIPNESEVRP